MKIYYERNFGCRITEYIYKGMKTISLENEKIRVTILVDKGTEIWEFLYKPEDIDFIWRMPKGLWNPAVYIPSSATEFSFFMDYYAGGWQEIMPNGGTASFYKGVEIGQHGEVALLPWNYYILEDTPENVSVKFSVRCQRTPFYLEKIVSLKRNTPFLFFEETLLNEAEETMELMWGHHPAFGEPFLDKNCEIEIPCKKIIVHSPQYHPNSRLKEGEYSYPYVKGRKGEKIDIRKIPDKNVKSADLCYFAELQEGRYILKNRKKKIAFCLKFDKRIFPYIWYWQEFKGGTGYPWWGTTYNIALEPFSSYPASGIQEAIRKKTQLKMKPKEKIKLYMETEIRKL